MTMSFENTPTAASKNPRRKGGIDEETFLSTNVSSPVQESRARAALRRAVNNVEVSLNFSQEGPDELGFLPIRDGSLKRKSSGKVSDPVSQRRKIGAPITMAADPVLSNLNPYEQEMLGRFLMKAREIRNEVQELLNIVWNQC